MSDTTTAAVVMAAGLGTRMRSAVPKHLHPVLGRRMVDWVLAAAREVDADPIVVVAGLVPFVGMILVLLLVRNTRATEAGLVRRI